MMKFWFHVLITEQKFPSCFKPESELKNLPLHRVEYKLWDVFHFNGICHAIYEQNYQETIITEESKPIGAFLESLKRNNKQIRDDRAAAICEDTELLFKRTIEDLEVAIKRMERERDNMLDLSPSDARSLFLAVDLGIKIRNERIKLDIARQRYNHLFNRGL